MGQRSVIFHAFLASLVPIAHAVGVAPSGLSSRDFYRSRRFRTTNSTPLGASIHDSASAESAVAVLDDLSRKSRVLLAQKRSGNNVEHRLLTWNAGGGAPQPEFLGGPWETEFGGLYSKVEQMTGVLLFEIAGCKVGDFTDAAYQKYAFRYKKMYDDFQKLKTENAEIAKDLSGLTFDTLLGGLEGAFNARYPETKPENPLGWITNTVAGEQKTCTLQEAIADSAGLCPSAEKAGQKDSKVVLTCDNFDLKSEGCWKKRGALPVFGERFFELYKLRKGPEPDAAKYWNVFMDGIGEQDEVAEKGCGPKETFPKGGKPGKHIGLALDKEIEYDILDKKTKKPASTKVATDDLFTLAQWSKTAAWDAITMELTSLSIKFLNLKGEKLTLEEGESFKVVPYIDDTVAKDTITKIVEGVQQKLQPDVIFFQEAGAVGDGSGYDIKKAPKDTAIHVRREFAGGIDDEASTALKEAWTKMGTSISAKLGEEMVIELGKQAWTDQKKEGDGDAEKYKVLGEEVIEKAEKGLPKQKEKAFSKIPYNGIPNRLLPTTDDGPEEVGEGEKKQTMAQRITDQTKAFQGAAAKGGNGLVWATKPDLVTIAVTKEEPKLLLLSIHSDGDGFYCAQFLNMAKQFYDAVSEHYKITRMYIGMDANVQPPYGHLSWANNKGMTFMQLNEKLPDGMKMLDPVQMTVKKVRSFLQTQFAKIGKDDEERKDLLFVYPGDYDKVITSVYNVYNPDSLVHDVFGSTFSYNAGKTTYFPTNVWPVDHFMSYADIYYLTDPKAAPDEKKKTVNQMCVALRLAGLRMQKSLGKACNAFKHRLSTTKKDGGKDKSGGGAKAPTAIGAPQIDATSIGEALAAKALAEIAK